MPGILSAISSWTISSPCPFSFDAVELDGNNFVHLNDYRCRWEASAGARQIAIYDYDRTRSQTGARRGVVSKQDLINVINAIEDPAWTYTPTTYRNVRTNQDWRTLWGYGPHQVPYRTGSRSEASVYCTQCNVLIPAFCVTVDHVKPQAGGGNQAMLKVFRALGLTAAGPKGTAGKWVFTTYKKAPAPGGATQKQDRYAMTFEGAAIFSAICSAGARADLKDACLNNIVNLRPMCIHCNTSKGNALPFV